MSETEKSNKEEKNQNSIERLQIYIDNTQKMVDYSIERFDILIISLSTSGLILSIGFVKNLITNFEKIDHSLLKITWLLFALALIANLLSQVTGYYANKLSIKVAKNKIRVKKGNVPKINEAKASRKKNIFNFGTKFLNAISLTCFISGIITLIIFVSKYI